MTPAPHDQTAANRAISPEPTSRVGLAALLHRMRIEAIVAAAETIRDWPVETERLIEAGKLIRHGMYLASVRELTPVEQTHLLSILAFAMPSDGDATW
jgi:hypothetical protein